eukprot:110933-Prymnesium_polylepis.1
MSIIPFDRCHNIEVRLRQWRNEGCDSDLHIDARCSVARTAICVEALALATSSRRFSGMSAGRAHHA